MVLQILLKSGYYKLVVNLFIWKEASDAQPQVEVPSGDFELLYKI